MKKCLALCLSTITTVVSSHEMPSHDVAQYVLQKLDVTSFPSSIGPRREAGKQTFADYGLTPVKMNAQSATLEDAEKSWEFDIEILSTTSSEIHICLRDFALHASYRAQSALILTAGRDGTLKATKTEDPACPNSP